MHQNPFYLKQHKKLYHSIKIKRYHAGTCPDPRVQAHLPYGWGGVSRQSHRISGEHFLPESERLKSDSEPVAVPVEVSFGQLATESYRDAADETEGQVPTGLGPDYQCHLGQRNLRAQLRFRRANLPAWASIEVSEGLMRRENAIGIINGVPSETPLLV